MKNQGVDLIRIKIAKWILPAGYNFHRNPPTGVKKPRKQKDQAVLPIVVSILLAAAILFPMYCSAAELLTFKDGTSMTFQTRHVKGDQFCTSRASGEFCVQRNDVKEVTLTDRGSEFEASESRVNSDIVSKRKAANDETAARQDIQDRIDAQARVKRDRQDSKARDAVRGAKLY